MNTCLYRIRCLWRLILLFFRHFAVRECEGLPESQKEIRLKIYPWQNHEVFKQAATGAVLSVASEMGFFVNGMLLPFSHPLTDALSRKNVSKLEKTSWQIIPLKQQSIKNLFLCQRIKELNITHWCPEYGYKNRNNNRKGEYKIVSLLQQRCFREHLWIACAPWWQTPKF